VHENLQLRAGLGAHRPDLFQRQLPGQIDPLDSRRTPEFGRRATGGIGLGRKVHFATGIDACYGRQHTGIGDNIGVEIERAQLLQITCQLGQLSRPQIGIEGQIYPFTGTAHQIPGPGQLLQGKITG
jgi:hypothetical protein